MRTKSIKMEQLVCGILVMIGALNFHACVIYSITGILIFYSNMSRIEKEHEYSVDKYTDTLLLSTKILLIPLLSFSAFGLNYYAKLLF